jgi:phage host-nuclease inhibitor protein Gam
MTTKRRKAAASTAPATTDEAIALIARYAELDLQMEEVAQAAEAQIAALRAWRDLQAEPLKAEMKALFNRLKPWWAVAKDELTAGRRKSIELAGCQIGHRTSTPKLSLKEEEAEVIEDLEFLGFSWALRVKRELDKPAIIAALAKLGEDSPDGHDARVLAGMGFTVSQGETFFIARIPPQEPPVDAVSDAPQAPVEGL